METKHEPGIKIIDGKGFHLKFKNGWTVSIQIGGGNYCANYDHPIGDTKNLPASRTAEYAAWGPDGGMISLGEDTVAGYKDIDEVLKFINRISRKKNKS